MIGHRSTQGAVMRHITICLLGPFQVTIDGAPVTSFQYAKVRALLAYLAVEAQRPHSRAELAALLWPDQPERTARGNLSQALTMLRTSLGDRGAAHPALLSDAQHVQLDPAAAIEVDVTRLLAALRASEGHAHRSRRTCAGCAESLQQALELYRGDFLADVSIPDSAVFDEWASLQREYLRQRALSTLERLLERAQWRGVATEALRYAHRLVTLEPLLEANQRAYMRLLAVNGEAAAALAQYRALQAMLSHELDAGPEPATTTLYQQIRRGDTVAWEPSPAPFGVPAAPTALVGRGDEVQTIGARLRDMQGRALSIIGTGGIGKTRLALEVAHALRYDYEDGIFMVELAALPDATLVAGAIAELLGVRERPRQSIGETLRDHLRAKHLLLVLDNFEHVVAAAPLVGELLAACPALTVLVTSRAPLNIRAEQQFVLAPLTDADAVELFVERAHAVGATLATDESSATVVAAICRQLDNLPLAIELAAARSKLFAPAALLARLSARLELLTGGAHDVPARQQTIRSTLDWSYRLLAPAEQQLLARLTVFVGGCSLEAAAAVCYDDSGTEHLPDTASMKTVPERVVPLAASPAPLDGLAALVDHSLVQTSYGPDGTPRVRMLETIRAYAMERLEMSGEADMLRRRHTAYFLALAEEAAPWLPGDERWGWLRRLEPEYDNLRAALVWSRDAGDPEYTAERLARALTWFWIMTSHRHEGRGWLEAVLQHLGPAGAAAAPRTVEWARAMIGMAIMGRGTNAVGARRLYQESIAICREVGERRLLIRALTHLGLDEARAGDYASGRSHCGESVFLAREEGDNWSLGLSLGAAGRVAVDEGDAERAAALYEEGLFVARRSGNEFLLAFHLEGLADVARERGRPAEAVPLYVEALGRFEALEDHTGPPSCLFGLAGAAAAQGHVEQAVDLYLQSLRRFRDAGMDVSYIAPTLAGLAAVAEQHPKGARRAARLLGAVEALYDAAGFPVPPRFRSTFDRDVAATRARLDGAAFAAAWAEGRAMTLEHAIAYALDERSDATAQPGADRRVQPFQPQLR